MSDNDVPAGQEELQMTRLKDIMKIKLSPSSRIGEWFLEIGFSLTAAWVLVWYMRLNADAFSWVHSAHVLRRLYSSRVFPSEGITVLAQVFWSLAIGLGIFLAIHFCIKMTQQIEFVMAAITVLILPAYLILDRGAFNSPARLPWSNFWILVEALLVFVGMYYFKRLRSFALGALIFVLHFSFAGWMSHSYKNVLEVYSIYGFGLALITCLVFYFGLPVFGLTATLGWVSTCCADFAGVEHST
jgi:hypothetical protein